MGRVDMPIRYKYFQIFIHVHSYPAEPFYSSTMVTWPSRLSACKKAIMYLQQSYLIDMRYIMIHIQCALWINMQTDWKTKPVQFVTLFTVITVDGIMWGAGSSLVLGSSLEYKFTFLAYALVTSTRRRL